MMGTPVPQFVDHIDFTFEVFEGGDKDTRHSSASGRYRCADQSFANQRPESRGVGLGEQVGPAADQVRDYLDTIAPETDHSQVSVVIVPDREPATGESPL